MGIKQAYLLLLFGFLYLNAGSTIFEDNIWATSKKIEFKQPKKYPELEALFMNAWAKVDLIRAINISGQHKLDFIEHIIEEVIYLYATTCRFLSICAYEKENINSLRALIADMKEATGEVFTSVNLPQVITLTCLLDQLSATVKKYSRIS